MGGDIEAGIGVVVAAELICPQGALQIGEGIAVRLEGAEQECQFKAAGRETVLVFQQRGRQEFVTALLHGTTPPGRRFNNEQSITWSKQKKQ